MLRLYDWQVDIAAIILLDYRESLRRQLEPLLRGIENIDVGLGMHALPFEEGIAQRWTPREEIEKVLRVGRQAMSLMVTAEDQFFESFEHVVLEEPQRARMGLVRLDRQWSRACYGLPSSYHTGRTTRPLPDRRTLVDRVNLIALIVDNNSIDQGLNLLEEQEDELADLVEMLKILQQRRLEEWQTTATYYSVRWLEIPEEGMSGSFARRNRENQQREMTAREMARFIRKEIIERVLALQEHIEEDLAEPFASDFHRAFMQAAAPQLRSEPLSISINIEMRTLPDELIDDIIRHHDMVDDLFALMLDWEWQIGMDEAAVEERRLLDFAYQRKLEQRNELRRKIRWHVSRLDSSEERK